MKKRLRSKAKSTAVRRTHQKTSRKSFSLKSLLLAALLLILPVIVVVSSQNQTLFSQAATITNTAGVTTIGSKMDSGNRNGISATYAVTGANSGTLKEIKVYIGKVNSAPRNHMQVAIYTDNGSNAPGTFLTSSASQVVQAKTWNTFAMTPVSITANTKYWLAFNVDGSSTQYAIAPASSPKTAWKIPTNYGSWPNPMGNLSEPVAAEQYSIYMVYLSDTAPTATPFPTATPSATPTFAPNNTPTPTPTPGADPTARIFTGDYETGNFNQWGNCQNVYLNDPCTGINQSHYAMQIVTNPVRQGTYAARYEVHNGDVPNFGGGERAEVSDDAGGAIEGDERWYQWSTQFTPNFPSGGWGAVASQWHDDSNNSPPLSFDVESDSTWGLMRNGNTWLWRTSQAPGTWQDIKIHIKWSSSSSVGFVELWHNGVRQTFTGGGCAGQTRCMTSTIGTGGIYFKQGIYRDQANTETGIIYHDGFTAARTEAGLGSL